MKYILFILFPLFSIGQNLTASDAIYFNGSAADKAYLNGDEVWSATAPIVNLFPTGNAASPGEDTNSIGDWFKENGGTPTSVSATDHNGGTSYVLQIVADDGSSDRARIDVTVESGVTYYYSYWAKQTVDTWASNTGCVMQSWVGIASPFIRYVDADGWKQYQGSFTTNATTLGIRAYAANSAGATWLIDDFYITTEAVPTE